MEQRAVPSSSSCSTKADGECGKGESRTGQYNVLMAVHFAYTGKYVYNHVYRTLQSVLAGYAVQHASQIL